VVAAEDFEKSPTQLLTARKLFDSKCDFLSIFGPIVDADFISQGNSAGGRVERKFHDRTIPISIQENPDFVLIVGGNAARRDAASVFIAPCPQIPEPTVLAHEFFVQMPALAAHDIRAP